VFFYQERIVFASQKRGEVCFLFPVLLSGGGIRLFQSYNSPCLKTFSLKEKLYHQTFLKRKFNQRTKAVFYQERIVFASEKRGEVCFLFPALIGGEGI